MKKHFFYLAAMAALLLGAGCADSPADVVEDDFQQRRTSEETKQLDPKLRTAIFKLISETITGDTATVTYELTFGDGMTMEETQKLEKRDGKWVIVQDQPAEPDAEQADMEESDDEYYEEDEEYYYDDEY